MRNLKGLHARRSAGAGCAGMKVPADRGRRWSATRTAPWTNWLCQIVLRPALFKALRTAQTRAKGFAQARCADRPERNSRAKPRRSGMLHPSLLAAPNLG